MCTLPDPCCCVVAVFAVVQQAEIGVDAGAYARLLMVHAKEAADAAADEVAAGTLSAQAILESAFYRTNVQGVSGGSRSTRAALGLGCEGRGGGSLLLVGFGHEVSAGRVSCFLNVARAAPSWVGVLQVGALSSRLMRLPLLAHELTRQGVNLWDASHLVRRALQWWCYVWYGPLTPAARPDPITCFCRLLLLLCCASGSSTACVLVINGTTLSASNLGDSGFVLVRDGVATFQCPQQQHNFNFPFQLGSADSMSDQPQAAMVSQCAMGRGSGCGCSDCVGCWWWWWPQAGRGAAKHVWLGCVPRQASRSSRCKMCHSLECSSWQGCIAHSQHSDCSAWLPLYVCVCLSLLSVSLSALSCRCSPATLL